MDYTLSLIQKLTTRYGSPLYVFDEQGFIANYLQLQKEFQDIYPQYRISYSFKTNYTPYIAGVVKRLGGYAEVVSDMEYEIAERLGFPPEKIIFNGPDKGEAGVRAFLAGSLINIDNLAETERLCEAARACPAKQFEVSLRVNADVGQNFISRFGLDPADIPSVFDRIRDIKNLKITGLHCHISRCRGLDAWKRRADNMLALAEKYFAEPPRFIDLGSGMFGSMAPYFAAQFDSVPTYREYAEAVAGAFAEHYRTTPAEQRPILFTEPGTTLVNRFVDLIAQVTALKTVRGKNFAVLDCSEHNLGETCTLKELPMEVFGIGERKELSCADFTGYTCLEQDVMRKNYNGPLAVGDYIVFGNVGGYSNVLKPPFIRPNCAMIALLPDGTTKLMKKRETFDDLLHTYIF